MNIHTYRTMKEIIAEIDPNDIEQLEEYASDCTMNHAFQTAKYINTQIKTENEIKISTLRYWLDKDFMGC